MTRKINIYCLTSFLCLALLILGIIFSLMPFISITSNNYVPSFFGSSVIKVKTESMLPEYKNNEIVIVNKVDSSKIKIGDRIAYYIFSENGNATDTAFHEVYAVFKNDKNECLYEVKGLANSEPEQKVVHQAAIIGIDKGGTFLKSLFVFSTSALGIILLIIFPILVLLTLQIILFISINMKKNSEKENVVSKKGKVNENKV